MSAFGALSSLISISSINPHDNTPTVSVRSFG
jgi:hypothetical protein